MIRLLFSFLLASLLYEVKSQETHVYVSPHPDDWQLFMNPSAYESLQDTTNTVIFLHTTAGDAGYGMANRDYALAREEGSLRAIRFLVNSLRSRGLGPMSTPNMETVEGHEIRKYQYGNAIAYFLRLPDGNFLGPGYERHGFTSLRKIFQRKVSSISAIDGSTTYNSLEDLQKTIVSLIGRDKELYLNVAETDTLANPKDHADHQFSSHIIQSIVDQLQPKRIRYYQEYATSKKPMNVEGPLFLICAGAWGATASGLSDYGHNSTWDNTHNAWIGRQYFREELFE